jgi:hypothetical protein
MNAEDVHHIVGVPHTFTVRQNTIRDDDGDPDKPSTIHAHYKVKPNYAWEYFKPNSDESSHGMIKPCPAAEEIQRVWLAMFDRFVSHGKRCADMATSVRLSIPADKPKVG